MGIPTVRLDRVQFALGDVAQRLVTSGVVDQVAWNYGAKPYQVSTAAAPQSLIRLELTSGPGVGSLIGPHGDYLWKVPTSVVVRITAVTVGQRLWLNLNRFEHWYDVQPGDTDVIIRDAFIASINTSEQGRVVASIVDDNEFLLTATAVAPQTDPFGNLWYLEFRQGVDTLIAGDGIFTGRAVKVQSKELPALVTFTAYSKNHEIRNGAQSILPELVAELETEEVVGFLSTYGIALRDRGPSISIPTLRGEGWETRASVDVNMTVQSHIIREVDLIEQATVDVNIVPAAGATFTINVDAQAP